MKDSNFICPLTNKEFYIPRYVMINGEYRERNIKGKQLINPENNEPLIPIKKEGPIEAPLVMGSSKDRMVRNQKYFKERAKKHAQTDEQKYLKKKVTEREMNKLKS